MPGVSPKTALLCLGRICAADGVGTQNVTVDTSDDVEDRVLPLDSVIALARKSGFQLRATTFDWRAMLAATATKTVLLVLRNANVVLVLGSGRDGVEEVVGPTQAGGSVRARALRLRGRAAGELSCSHVGTEGVVGGCVNGKRPRMHPLNNWWAAQPRRPTDGGFGEAALPDRGITQTSQFLFLTTRPGNCSRFALSEGTPGFDAVVTSIAVRDADGAPCGAGPKTLEPLAPTIGGRESSAGTRSAAPRLCRRCRSRADTRACRVYPIQTCGVSRKTGPSLECALVRRRPGNHLWRRIFSGNRGPTTGFVGSGIVGASLQGRSRSGPGAAPGLAGKWGASRAGNAHL